MEQQVCQFRTVSTKGFTPRGCVKTVSEPLGLEPIEICFERKADSPSYCFFEKVIRKRRA
jgi:hypothetical protein